MPRTWCWQHGFRLPAVQAVGHAGAPMAPTRHQPEVMFPLSSVMLFKTEFKTGRIKANFRIFISSLKWVICRKCKLWRLSSRFSCCGLLWLLQSILSYFKKKKKNNFIRNSSIPFKNQSLKCIQLARKIKSFWHNITGANNRFLQLILDNWEAVYPGCTVNLHGESSYKLPSSLTYFSISTSIKMGERHQKLTLKCFSKNIHKKENSNKWLKWDFILLMDYSNCLSNINDYKWSCAIYFVQQVLF